MTYCTCSNDVIFGWRASLQHAISQKPKDILLASTWYLLAHRRGRIVYYLVEFKTTNKHKQIFVHKPD